MLFTIETSVAEMPVALRTSIAIDRSNLEALSSALLEFDDGGEVVVAFEIIVTVVVLLTELLFSIELANSPSVELESVVERVLVEDGTTLLAPLVESLVFMT